MQNEEVGFEFYWILFNICILHNRLAMFAEKLKKGGEVNVVPTHGLTKALELMFHIL